jgi:outer membrane protein TolC
MNRLRLSAVMAAMLAAGPFAAAAQTLPDLLQAVLDHPAIAARQAEAAAAQKQLDAATAGYFGSGVLGAEDTTYDDSQFLGTFTPAAFRNPPFAQTQLRYGASYNLPIDLFGVIAANRARARSDLSAARLAQRQEVLMKLHQTVDAWAQLQAVAAREHALELEHERVQATVARVTGEVAAGLAAKSDLSLAGAELAHAEAASVRLQGERAQLLAMLQDATGEALATADAVPATAVTIPAWPAADQPADTLPVRMAAAQAAAAADGARAATRALLPTLSAGAGYAHYEGSGIGEDTWNVGARVSLPLDPSAWQKRAAAEAQAQAAKSAQADAARRATRNWVALNGAYDAAVADVAASEKEVAGRRDVVAVQTELARAGSVTTEDLLRHERDLIDAESRLADARVRAIDAWSAAQILLGTDPQTYIAAWK